MKAPIKSIAVPASRRGAVKLRPAGPAPDDEGLGISLAPDRPSVAAPAAALQPLYEVGQRLRLLGGGNRWARAQSVCRVLAVLPRDSGPFQYRVQSEAEAYERIVAETDLAPAA